VRGLLAVLANGGLMKAAYDIFEKAFFKGSSKNDYSSF
jgi:hypothetical protein